MKCFGLAPLVLPVLLSCRTDVRREVKIRTYTDGRIEVVRPDYGILSIAQRTRKVGRPLMWRCFPIKDIDVRYRTWPFTDPMNPKRIIDTRCEFEMHVRRGSEYHIYHGRRGEPVAYCTKFKSAWKKLTLGEEHMCLDGETISEGEPQHVEGLKEMAATWTWDKIMTKKGCYGFWDAYECTSF